MRVSLVIYGSLSTLTGRLLYDRRLVEHLSARGDEVEVVAAVAQLGPPPHRNASPALARRLTAGASTSCSETTNPPLPRADEPPAQAPPRVSGCRDRARPALRRLWHVAAARPVRRRRAALSGRCRRGRLLRQATRMRPSTCSARGSRASSRIPRATVSVRWRRQPPSSRARANRGRRPSSASRRRARQGPARAD